MLKDCDDDYFEVYSDQTSSEGRRRSSSTLKSKLRKSLSHDRKEESGTYHEQLLNDGAKVVRVAIYTATYWRLNFSRDKAIADPPTIVVLDTDLGIHVSVGLLQGSFMIYESKTRQNVIHVISKRRPVESVIEDSCDYPFSQLMDCLKREKSNHITAPGLSNQFAKQIFAKVGQSHFDLNEKYFKLRDVENVAETFLGRNHENLIQNAVITNIAVYKTHFDRLETDPLPSLDNQTFVILKTNCGFFSVQKKPDGLFIGKSTWFEWLYGMVVDDESHDIKLMVVEESDCCLSSLLGLLKKLENQEHFLSIYDFLIMDRILSEVSLCQYTNVHFKLSSVHNVEEKIFGLEHEKLLKNIVVKRVGVYKTPLTALYKSSHSSIKQYFAKQWTAVDYHAFLVLKTNLNENSLNGVFLCLEKQQDGIYISKSPLYECLVYGLQFSPRNSPVELIIEDESKYPLSDLIGRLKYEEDVYNPTKNNCQHFAKRHFDRAASKKYWEFERPGEYLYKLTSLVLFLILMIVFLCYLPIGIYIHNVLKDTPFILLFSIIKHCSLYTSSLLSYCWLHIMRGAFLLVSIVVFFKVILGT